MWSKHEKQPVTYKQPSFLLIPFVQYSQRRLAQSNILSPSHREQILDHLIVHSLVLRQMISFAQPPHIVIHRRLIDFKTRDSPAHGQFHSASQFRAPACQVVMTLVLGWILGFRRRATVLPLCFIGIVAVGRVVAKLGVARIAEGDQHLVALDVLLGEGRDFATLDWRGREEGSA